MEQVALEALGAWVALEALVEQGALVPWVGELVA